MEYCPWPRRAPHFGICRELNIHFVLVCLPDDLCNCFLFNVFVQASLQPGGTVTFEHRNLQGLNRSLIGSVTTSNFLNPQVLLYYSIEFFPII